MARGSWTVDRGKAFNVSAQVSAVDHCAGSTNGVDRPLFPIHRGPSPTIAIWKEGSEVVEESTTTASHVGTMLIGCALVRCTFDPRSGTITCPCRPQIHSDQLRSSVPTVRS